jgi:hypothetical protein
MKYNAITASFLLLTFLVSCMQQPTSPAMPDITTVTELQQYMQPVADASAFPDSSGEASVPLGYYEGTDAGVVEYSFVNEDGTPKPLSEIKPKLSTGPNGMSPSLAAFLKSDNEARKEYYRQQEEAINPQAVETKCFVISTFNSGCHYLVESNQANSFNGVDMQVTLPSRSSFDILVEEDNQPSCPRNKTNKAEVPYIFLGGHDKGTQNIDAGLFWNCGNTKDNWALFTNTSDDDQYSSISTWRLVSEQKARVLFFIDNDDYPVLYAQGNWINAAGTETLTDAHIYYKCNTAKCKGKNWDYTGKNINLRMEINLAQTVGTTPKADFKSGARFADTVVKTIYMGNYNRSTNAWTNVKNWNISKDKSSSSLTKVQCLIPGSNGYTISGVANRTLLGFGGMKVSLVLPKN